MLWLTIGAALCGLAVGLWLRSIFDYARGLPSSQKLMEEKKNALRDTAYGLLNDPYISVSGRAEILKILRYHNMEVEPEPPVSGWISW